MVSVTPDGGAIERLKRTLSTRTIAHLACAGCGAGADNDNAETVRQQEIGIKCLQGILDGFRRSVTALGALQANDSGRWSTFSSDTALRHTWLQRRQREYGDFVSRVLLCIPSNVSATAAGSSIGQSPAPVHYLLLNARSAHVAIAGLDALFGFGKGGKADKDATTEGSGAEAAEPPSVFQSCKRYCIEYIQSASSGHVGATERAKAVSFLRSASLRNILLQTRAFFPDIGNLTACGDSVSTEILSEQARADRVRAGGGSSDCLTFNPYFKRSATQDVGIAKRRVIERLEQLIRDDDMWLHGGAGTEQDEGLSFHPFFGDGK